VKISDEQIIYFDNNSTTKTDDRVIDVMVPIMKEFYANPSSSHSFGKNVKKLIVEARDHVSNLINCKPEEIVFTSGSTESINLALRGLASSAYNSKKRIVTISTEHKAVLDTCKKLESQGFEIIYLPVKKDGIIDIDIFSSVIDDNTMLVIAMHVNNETGVINDIQKLTEIAHSKGALFFCDATQSFGKIPIDIIKLNVDLLCFSGHKFHGPKGVGGLFVNKELKIKIEPQITGGSQEYGIRSGTLNSAGIIGLGEACLISSGDISKIEVNVRALRDYLEKELLKIPGTFINGNLESRIYNTSNICFPNNDANVIIGRLKNIALSNGSACTSSIVEPSHVLSSMGLTNEQAFSAIRFSLSKYNAKTEIDEVVSAIKNVIIENSILAQ
jgi:cysteine desulfurase